MGRSFCNGCRFWIKYTDLFGTRFWFCARFDVCELSKRRELCNKKFYINKPKKD